MAGLANTASIRYSTSIFEIFVRPNQNFRSGRTIACVGLSVCTCQFFHCIKSCHSNAGRNSLHTFRYFACSVNARKTCNFHKRLNHILKVMDGCMHIFCLVSIKTHITRKLELQPSPFFYRLAA